MNRLLRTQLSATDVMARRPTIVPTRRRLDRRFPTLGFTISTEAPWIEVLVTTDPALLAASRAVDRKPATFYASRSHGGLTPTTAGRARYVVPPAVLDRLVSSGAALWYVAVAYADAGGTGGVASVDTGASGMVVVDRSVRSRRGGTALSSRSGPGSVARGLDVAVAAAPDRLEGEDGADLVLNVIPGAAVTAQGWHGAQVARGLTADDRLEGEDGAALADAPASAPAAAPAAPAALAKVTPRMNEPVLPPVPARTPPVPTSGDGVPTVTVPVNGSTANSHEASVAPPPRSDPSTASEAMAYDDGWDSLGSGTVPALGADLDEYPDIDWGDIDDVYGQRPAYQSLEDADTVDGSSTNGATPQEGGARLAALPQLELSPETQRRIIEQTVGADDGAYAAVNADGPFRGRHGPGHKAFGRFHTGLSFGIAEFNQDAGTLGQLLRLMREREPETFAAVFGESAAALVDTATAPGPSSEHVDGGRGARIQLVDGADLWEEPWVSRFRAAGAVPAFRAAQNQLAAELYLVPMLPVAAGLGLTTERALCLVLDRAIALGEQGAKRWLADTVGPARTPTLRHAALAALGFDSIEAFQQSVPGLLVDGEFGPVTHAALAAALRLSAHSPVPLPDIATAVALIAQRGETEDGSARLVRLASAPGLGDVPIGG